MKQNISLQNSYRFIKPWLFIIPVCCTVFLSGCKKYLDVVPDNVATLDDAFTLKQEAQKYLFTCYSYLPNDADYGQNPGFGAGNECWQNIKFTTVSSDPLNIAEGNQNASNPLMNIWGNMYQALRDCNIFLDNIDHVIDLSDADKTRWKSEVMFLKAYYHWLLLRRYGPIPIVDKNIPVDASIDAVKVKRQTVDSVVNYITNLMGVAANNLPLNVNRDNEYGRISRTIALSIKARVLVTAASPLFNGNTDYASFKTTDGTPFFNQAYDASKWQKAADACKAAIDACNQINDTLFRYVSGLQDHPALSDKLTVQMGIRNAVCEKWNQEVIWGDVNHQASDVQKMCAARLDSTKLGNQSSMGQYAATLETAELFYTKNGVPIDEDISYNYAGRYNLQTATDDDSEYIKNGYQTAVLHFNREPRFYADLAFDGSMWIMLNNRWHLEAKFGQWNSQKDKDNYSITGYFTKKLVEWHYTIGDGGDIQLTSYPWPVMRVADLYLLYCEALNEVSGPSKEAYNYIDMVRARAGLPTVEDAWTNYSNTPGEYQSKDGFRKIIQRERMIELAFEASNFWDLRRWKRSLEEMNAPIRGWNIMQSDAKYYYLPVTVFTPSFSIKDYFWPLQTNDIVINPNLVQNPGWE
jgi:hypothetical protein